MIVINGKIMRKKRKRLIKSPDGVLIEDKNQVTEYETDEEYLPIEDRRKRLALKESRVGGQLEKRTHEKRRANRESPMLMDLYQFYTR